VLQSGVHMNFVNEAICRRKARSYIELVPKWGDFRSMSAMASRTTIPQAHNLCIAS
jgi:hypothetical protein